MATSTLTAYVIQELTNEFEILLQDFYVCKVNNFDLEIHFTNYGPYSHTIKTTYIPFTYRYYKIILN